MVRTLNTKECPKCGAGVFIVEKEEWTLGFLKFADPKADKIAENIKSILESPQDAYEKKVALFNLVKKLELGDIAPNEEKRINCLLEGKLYNELAKQKMEEYKKLTAEDFSKK